jgi:hypothetical protein
VEIYDFFCLSFVWENKNSLGKLISGNSKLITDNLEGTEIKVIKKGRIRVKLHELFSLVKFALV